MCGVCRFSFIPLRFYCTYLYTFCSYLLNIFFVHYFQPKSDAATFQNPSLTYRHLARICILCQPKCTPATKTHRLLIYVLESLSPLLHSKQPEGKGLYVIHLTRAPGGLPCLEVWFVYQILLEISLTNYLDTKLLSLGMFCFGF